MTWHGIEMVGIRPTTTLDKDECHAEKNIDETIVFIDRHSLA